MRLIALMTFSLWIAASIAACQDDAVTSCDAAGASGEGGTAGAAGVGGAAGNGGAAGTAGAAGNAGVGGAAGNAGVGGAAGNAGVGGAAGSAGSGGGSAALADILSAETFAALFLHQAESACNAQAFTHAALLEAAADFPAFANEGSDEIRRREVAAFLANISHETTGGWSAAPDGPAAWGLCFREEVGCGGGACTGYCDPSNVMYPCAQGVTYHGRGPMQLSWNYNYGYVGSVLGIDLLSDPSLVVTNPVIGWKTAIWFWMTPQMPKPSAHDVMVGNWTPSQQDQTAGRVPGFGMTVNIINGGLECNIVDDHRVEDRVAFFERYVGILGTTTGDNLRCETMQSY